MLQVGCGKRCEPASYYGQRMRLQHGRTRRSAVPQTPRKVPGSTPRDTHPSLPLPPAPTVFPTEEWPGWFSETDVMVVSPRDVCSREVMLAAPRLRAVVSTV